jgi:hypothetical protein
MRPVAIGVAISGSARHSSARESSRNALATTISNHESIGRTVEVLYGAAVFGTVGSRRTSVQWHDQAAVSAILNEYKDRRKRSCVGRVPLSMLLPNARGAIHAMALTIFGSTL